MAGRRQRLCACGNPIVNRAAKQCRACYNASRREQSAGRARRPRPMSRTRALRQIRAEARDRTGFVSGGGGLCDSAGVFDYDRRRALDEELTVRCQRCGWSATGVARVALGDFRSHREACPA